MVVWITDYDVKILKAIQQNPGITMTQMTKKTGINSSNTSTRLYRFTKAGYLECKENEKNRSEKLYTITEDGGAFLCLLSKLEWSKKKAQGV